MPLGAPPSKLPHFSQLSVLRASPVYTNSLVGVKEILNGALGLGAGSRDRAVG